jgi:hypothetical protein
MANGFMGFGMQKENYTRKPKEVFTKIKANREQDHSPKRDAEKVDYDGLIEFHKNRHNTSALSKVIRFVFYLVAFLGALLLLIGRLKLL